MSDTKHSDSDNIPFDSDFEDASDTVGDLIHAIKRNRVLEIERIIKCDLMKAQLMRGKIDLLSIAVDTAYELKNAAAFKVLAYRARWLFKYFSGLETIIEKGKNSDEKVVKKLVDTYRKYYPTD